MFENLRIFNSCAHSYTLHNLFCRFFTKSCNKIWSRPHKQGCCWWRGFPPPNSFLPATQGFPNPALGIWVTWGKLFIIDWTLNLKKNSWCFHLIWKLHQIPFKVFHHNNSRSFADHNNSWWLCCHLILKYLLCCCGCEQPVKKVNQFCLSPPIGNRVFHITPFFELSYTLLTTHAHGLYEVTKKFQRYRQ